MQVNKVLRQFHEMMQVLPTSRRRMLFERLRVKIAEDITTVMREQGFSIEDLAKKLKMKNQDIREWIWTRNLTLSELARLLDCLDSEFYPIIRPRKLGRNL